MSVAGSGADELLETGGFDLVLIVPHLVLGFKFRYFWGTGLSFERISIGSRYDRGIAALFVFSREASSSCRIVCALGS